MVQENTLEMYTDQSSSNHDNKHSINAKTIPDQTYLLNPQSNKSPSLLEKDSHNELNGSKVNGDLKSDEPEVTFDLDNKKKADLSSIEEEDGLPIDRGWAWLVLAGSFLNVILMVGYGRAIGILFVEYLKVFESSATKTTLFMAVMAGTFSISALLAMTIILQYISIRKMVILGGVISSIGMLTAVFATSITFLICTHSILIGIGHSMIHGPALVLIGHYFKKRRGLATAVSMSGISLGGSIFPPLVRYLLDEYGVRGSMLLLTGLTMNVIVGGALFRPLSSFRSMHSKSESLGDTNEEEEPLDSFKSLGDKEESRDKEEEREPLTKDVKDDEVVKIEMDKTPFSPKPGLQQQLSHDPLLRDKVDVHKRDFSRQVSHDANCGPRKRFRTLSDGSKLSVEEVTISQLQLYTSNPDLTSMSLLSIPQADIKIDDKEENIKSKGVSRYLKIALASLDFKLFKNPMFQLIAVTSNVSVMFGLVGIYLPALATEKGVPETEASFLLTICGTLDFFSRLAVGYFADLKRVKVHHIMAIGMIISGAFTQFAPLYNSYELLIVFSVFSGLFGSIYHCLVPVYIVEFMGIDNMAKTLGFVSLFHGFSISLSHPIMGAIKDLTGSYSMCFNFIGACNFIGALCLFCEPLARRRLEKVKNTKTDMTSP